MNTQPPAPSEWPETLAGEGTDTSIEQMLIEEQGT